MYPAALLCRRGELPHRHVPPGWGGLQGEFAVNRSRDTGSRVETPSGMGDLLDSNQ